MMEYIDGSVLIVDDYAYVPHKGHAVDTLIITKQVWEDPESKTCLMPFVWTAKKVIIVDNGKFKDIKKDKDTLKEDNISKDKLKEKEMQKTKKFNGWLPKMDAQKNTLHILKIKMPMNMVTYKLLDEDNKTLTEKGVSWSRRFVAKVEGIPSYLIKKVEFSDLNWSSDELAIATIYCYQPANEDIFSIKEYILKNKAWIYSVEEIPEIQHKGIVAKPVPTIKVHRKEAIGNSKAHPLPDCDCLFCVEEIPMRLDLITSDADWKTLGGQMKDYFKKERK